MLINMFAAYVMLYIANYDDICSIAEQNIFMDSCAIWKLISWTEKKEVIDHLGYKE